MGFMRHKKVEVQISIEPILEENPKPRNLLKDHINFGYYILLYPFRVYEEDPGCFALRRSRVQQALCLFSHTCVFLFSMLYLRAFTKNEIYEKPESMFIIAEGCSEIGRCYTFLTILWLKRNTLLEALPKFSKKLGLKVLIGIYTIHVFIFLRAILSVVYYDFIVISLRNELTMYKDAVNQARYIFLLSPHPEDTTYWEESRVGDIVTISVFYTLVFAKEIVTQSADSLFWVLSIYALLSCRKLKFIAQSSQSDKEEVLQQFATTKSLLDSINAINSVYVLVKFLSLVPLYSGDGFSIFEDTDWGHHIVFLTYIFTSFVPFFLAAEAHYRVSRIICPEYSGEALELMKGYRFFTVTYGFIGSTCVIVVTYAILVLQFNISSRPENECSN